MKEEHNKQAILTLLQEEGVEVEGAGAITLAACMYNLRDHLHGKK